MTNIQLGVIFTISGGILSLFMPPSGNKYVLCLGKTVRGLVHPRDYAESEPDSSEHRRCFKPDEALLHRTKKMKKWVLFLFLA